MIMKIMTSSIKKGRLPQNVKGAKPTKGLKPTRGDVVGFTIDAVLMLRSIPSVQDFESTMAVGSSKFFRKCFLEEGEQWHSLTQYEQQINSCALKIKNLLANKGLKAYPEVLRLIDEVLMVRTKLECMLQENCEVLIDLRNQANEGAVRPSVAAIENKMDNLLYAIQLHILASGFISICFRFAPQRTSRATSDTNAFLTTVFSFANRKALLELCKDNEQQQFIGNCRDEMKKAARLSYLTDVTQL